MVIVRQAERPCSSNSVMHAQRRLSVRRAGSVCKIAFCMSAYCRHDVCQHAAASAQESYTADSYTQEGLDHIRATNFKSLVLRHYPELKARPLLVCIPLLRPWPLPLSTCCCSVWIRRMTAPPDEQLQMSSHVGEAGMFCISTSGICEESTCTVSTQRLSERAEQVLDAIPCWFRTPLATPRATTPSSHGLARPDMAPTKRPRQHATQPQLQLDGCAA